MLLRDDIIRMAQKSGFQTSEIWGAIVNGTPITEELKSFANLVSAHERDWCAYLCSATAPGRDAEAIEEAIRKRGEK